MNYEYGIRYSKNPDGPHRWDMTEEEAHEWVREVEEMGTLKGGFLVIRRSLGDWEDVEQNEAP